MSLVEHRPNTTSPFYPNTLTQFAWDSVSLGTALSCARKYQYYIIEGWEHRGGKDAIALTFGIAFHSAMEAYQKALAAGADHEEAVRTTVKVMLTHPCFLALPTHDEAAALIDDTPEDDDGITVRNTRNRTRYHLFRAIIWYLEHYRNDPVKTLIIGGKPLVEYSFRIPLFDDFILSGHLDRVGELDGRVYVIDWKSTKSISSQFFAAFDLSHQISGYTLAGKVALETPVSGAVIDGIALLLGGVKFARAPSNRTPSQLDEFVDDAAEVILSMKKHGERKLADPSYEYPKNTQSCYFCQFKEICRQPREYRRRYLGMHFQQDKPWNPLESR